MSGAVINSATAARSPPAHHQRKTSKVSLRREIIFALAVKLALIYGLWFLFFSEPQIKKMTEGMEPGRVAASVLATGDPKGPAAP